jgi:hypothetical protein
VREDGFCFWHSPSTASDRDEARRRGGQAKSSLNRARKQMQDAALSPSELQGYIAVTLRGVLTGTISPGQGNAVASLARAAITIREATVIEERLDALEQRLDGKKVS